MISKITPGVTPDSKVLALGSRKANQSPDPERRRGGGEGNVAYYKYYRKICTASSLQLRDRGRKWTPPAANPDLSLLIHHGASSSPAAHYSYRPPPPPPQEEPASHAR
ncbi:hypothetical protein NQZ68_011286 [Dissostichus eleginoides]|nr:hypothetical protein NQZ68_011286 [Dissostichus eleginoides]